MRQFPDSRQCEADRKATSRDSRLGLSSSWRAGRVLPPCGGCAWGGGVEA